MNKLGPQKGYLSTGIYGEIKILGLILTSSLLYIGSDDRRLIIYYNVTNSVDLQDYKGPNIYNHVSKTEKKNIKQHICIYM